MVTMLSKSDGVISTIFNNNKISYIYYSIGKDFYVMPEEKIEKLTTTKDLEKEYNALLKKMF